MKHPATTTIISPRGFTRCLLLQRLFRCLPRRAVLACAAIAAAFAFSGCAEEVPEYRSFIYYEAEATTNRDFTTTVHLPLQNRSYTVLNKAQFWDLAFSDVFPVRVIPDSRSPNGCRYEILRERNADTSPVAPEGTLPKQSLPASANVASPPPPSRTPDMSFPALLVRLEHRADADLRQDTFNIQGRTIFLVVNKVVVGARRVTAPIVRGEVYFHWQVPPVQEPGETDAAFAARYKRGETREEQEARIIKFAKDLNRSLVVLQKLTKETK
jgi:hypothetical protein